MRRVGYWLALLLAWSGCSENVGFLAVELVVPDRSPALVCSADPRRAEEVTVAADCGGETHEQRTRIEDGEFSLSDLPLGECQLQVDVFNSHQRKVLAGTAEIEVGRGDNNPVQLQLIEERCVTASCDGDGDGLADQDEQALGTDASKVDSDGDGLEDGLELMQCCTDPLKPEGQCRELLIQRVEPGMGPVGTAVMVKASAPLESPKVTVGGKALQNLLADSTIAFGTVAPGSSLGEVRLTSGGGTVSYSNLFAVLRDAPESLAEISNRATGAGPVIYQLVDQVFDGPRHYLLGRSFIGGSGGSPTNVVPMLLLIDHQSSAAFRGVVALKGEPVAVSAAAGQALVLLDVDGQAALVHYGPAALPGGLGLPQKLSFTAAELATLKDPVELVLEASGDTALVLLKQGLVRFRFDGDGKVVALRSLPLGKLLGPLGPTSCVGLAYRAAAGKEAAYLACNASLPCPGGSCQPQGLLARVPLPGCLDLGSIKTGGCLTTHLVGVRRRLLANPAVDSAQGQLHLLAGDGVVTAPLDNPPKLLWTLVPMQWSGTTEATDRMAVEGKYLYVVDGPRVWRMEPGGADPSAKKGKPFVMSRGADEAQMVAVSPDGAALSVALQVQGGFSWLAGVCLEACTP